MVGPLEPYIKMCPKLTLQTYINHFKMTDVIELYHIVRGYIYALSNKKEHMWAIWMMESCISSIPTIDEPYIFISEDDHFVTKIYKGEENGS